MGPAQRLITGVVVATLAAVGFVIGRIALRPGEQVVQPIAFNHSVHADGLECETCHELFATSAHSGLPGLTTCLMCHEDALTEQAEEEKIRSLAADGEEQVFRKLFRLADHVFYTHRRHAEVAEIDCDVCHGGIALTTSPPETPLIRVDMDFCVDCHEAQGAPTDCTRCHR